MLSLFFKNVFLKFFVRYCLLHISYEFEDIDKETCFGKVKNCRGFRKRDIFVPNHHTPCCPSPFTVVISIRSFPFCMILITYGIPNVPMELHEKKGTLSCHNCFQYDRLKYMYKPHILILSLFFPPIVPGQTCTRMLFIFFLTIQTLFIFYCVLVHILSIKINQSIKTPPLGTPHPNPCYHTHHPLLPHAPPLATPHYFAIHFPPLALPLPPLTTPT